MLSSLLPYKWLVIGAAWALSVGYVFKTAYNFGHDRATVACEIDKAALRKTIEDANAQIQATRDEWAAKYDELAAQHNERARQFEQTEAELEKKVREYELELEAKSDPIKPVVKVIGNGCRALTADDIKRLRD